MPIRICHIITDLDLGGAEMMLHKFLAESSKNKKFEQIVISLQTPGKVGALIERSGVKIYSLEFNHGVWDVAKNLFNLIRVLYEFQPDIVQGWMYHANISALLAKLLLPYSTVSWNIRQALYNIRYEKKRTRLIIRMGAVFSRWPDKIVYNSTIGSGQHARMGYHPGNQEIIPNGFDLNRFKPDGNHRKEIRTLLEIGENDIIIGLVARYHPVKDHLNFIKAAGIIQKQRENVFYILIGRKLDPDNEIIVNALKREGVFCQTRLLGEQKEMFRLFPAFDIATLCSVSEGFPNVIGEAMPVVSPAWQPMLEIQDRSWKAPA